MAARGSVSAAWSITALGHVATCAQVGATSVSVLLHSRANTEDVTAAFPCTDTQGTTPPVVAGAFDATLTLRAADGAAIATAPIQAAITVAAGQVTELAPVVFPADGRGKLALSVVALTTRTNCLPRDQGGAGITGFAIDLEHAADGCAPVTFTRSRGTTTLGTYTVSCSSPSVTSCIERDETLTVDTIDPGPYALGVNALIGPVRCWGGTEVLSVPAGATLARPIQLAPTPATGCGG
jgi:hypothetical protein